ncbi:hypothetical protein R3P38DRAFT_3224314 [Favolaschia claudopus]|uniref:Uncharacterized protein n=1 Tax=Favolaschia claudopus TaxID=2862362 RepID=A0AAV9ZX29_9AGAR
MAEVIDLEPDVLFDPSEWICAQKVYKNVPIHVADAFSAVRRLPQSLLSKFPAETVSISDFLAVQPPGIIAARTKLPGTSPTARST